MPTPKLSSRRKQRGQTLMLVAIAMVSLLAIAALAVDLVSLYAARGEIQRAADAAALAGAKAFVDSAVTTDPTLQPMAQTMAQAYASAAAAQNLVSGGAPQFSSPPTFDFTTYPGNPRISVTLERSGLPLFFARIWGGQFASVSASAVAEAYNPAYSQSNTKSFVPTAPKCVKPFLVPNNDSAPGTTSPIYVDPSSGAPQPSALSLLGRTLSLDSACKRGGNGCTLLNGQTAPRKFQYLPMQGLSPHRYCPALSSPGCSAPAGNFQQSIQCCDGAAFDFAQCGQSATPATWDPSVNPSRGQSENGLQCLIHTTAGSNQQDTLDPSKFLSGTGPVLISPGPYSQSLYGLQATDLMATSDSIITVPLFDNSHPQLPANVTIVGFLQLFVLDVGSGAQSGDFTTVILNISGCGQAMGSGGISGGGISAIAVRLVQQ